MKGQKIFTITILLALIVAGLAAESNGTHELKGRDIAETGVRMVISGTLKTVDGEWYLEAGNTVYTLHLGQYGDQADMLFKAGIEATVTAFVTGNDMAPIKITSNNQSLEFWREDRKPQWAGKGNRANGGGKARH